MEELLAKKNALEEQQQKIDEESSRIYRELEEVTAQIRNIEINEMSEDYTNQLLRRLTLLKRYVETACDIHKFVELAYKIKRMERPRQDDYHEDIPDYVSWTIYDDECLAMTYYVDIVIEIYSPTVEKFVVDWITAHIPDMKKDRLFGRYD